MIVLADLPSTNRHPPSPLKYAKWFSLYKKSPLSGIRLPVLIYCNLEFKLFICLSYSFSDGGFLIQVVLHRLSLWSCFSVSEQMDPQRAFGLKYRVQCGPALSIIIVCLLVYLLYYFALNFVTGAPWIISKKHDSDMLCSFCVYNPIMSCRIMNSTI